MTPPDLNLLFALDVLLEELSVARAARRMRLSASAMSRTLARLRDTTDDPLLVRAGRKLVATPRALELRERVSPLVREAEAVLRPAGGIDPQSLDKTFTLRTSEGFVETFGPALIARVAAEAPRVHLRFVQKPDKDSAPMREGMVDLETGVVDGATGPEVRTLALFRDRLIGVIRAQHPLAGGRITLKRYLAARHIDVRRGAERTPPPMGSAPARGPLDAGSSDPSALGVERDVATTVAGFATAIALARATDLVATVPERHTAGLRDGTFDFELPFAAPTFTVSLLWHPRLDADPAHRWLRGVVRDTCSPAERSRPIGGAARARATR